MPQKIKTRAYENGSFILVANFVETTADGLTDNPIIPNDNLVWTLTDSEGNVVNERSLVSISPPAESVYIVLSGEDLVLNGNYPEKRFVTIEGTYDSVIGIGIPFRVQAVFQIENLVDEALGE